MSFNRRTVFQSRFALLNSLLAIVAMGIYCASAQAATVLWDGGATVSGTNGSGINIGTAANWGTSGNPTANALPVNGDTIEFSGFDSVTTDLSINASLLLTGATAFNVTQANALTFTGTAASSYIRIANGGTVTVSAGAGAVNFNNLARLLYGSGTGTTSAFTLTQDSSNAMAYAANASGDIMGGTGIRNITITGSGTGGWTYNQAITSGTGQTMNLIKSGSMLLFLNGANTFTGSVTLNTGELQVGTNSALGAAANGFTINGGTVTPRFGSRTLANNVTVGGDFTLGLAATNNAISFTGTVDLGGATRTVTVVDNLVDPDATFSNVVSNGGLTKAGAGSLTLSGNNTYTGPTNIDAGKLVVAGSISSSALSLNSGTLDGTGSVGATTVVNNGANKVANGNGGTGTLTLNSLTFNGAATIEARTGGGVPFAVTNALTTSLDNGVTVNGNGVWAIGTNNLISYGSFSGDIGDFSLGTISGLNPRQTLGSLVNTGTHIALTVNGDSPKWTGLDNTGWIVGTTGANGNWKLVTAGTPADYIQGDSVLFDDTAAGSGPIFVDINTGNVSPSATEFNNSTKDYILDSFSLSGIASGSLTKNGSKDVTINASVSNTYSGPTTINAGSLTLQGSHANTGGTVLNGGTLNIGSASSLGAAANTLTIAGGSIDNTSGLPITLTNTGAQSWNGDFTFIGSQSLNLNTGAVTLSATRQVTVSASDLTVGGAIGGGGFGLTKAGAGTLTLAGNNTYTGATTVTAGTLSLGAAERIANTSALVVSGGTFELNNFSETVASLSDGGSSGGTVTNSNFTMSTLNLNGAASTTYSGTISGFMNLAKNAPGSVGTLTLTGANTFLGQIIIGGGGAISVSSINSVVGGTSSSNLGAPTTVTNGTIRLAGNSASGKLIYTGTGETTDRVILIDGGTVGATDGVLDHSGTGTLRFTSNFAVLNVPHTFVLQGSTSGIGQIDGVIPDDADADVTSLRKQGTGTWVLGGANTYAGGTTVNGGTLDVDGAAATLGTGNVAVGGAGAVVEISTGVGNAIADSAVLDLSTGGMMNLGAGISELVGSLFLDGILQAPGTYGSTASAAIFRNDAYFNISGTGLLTVPSLSVLGDYNDNNFVDAADYVLYRNGVTPLPANEVENIGVTNDQDWVEWKARFGNPAPGGGSESSLVGEGSAVPEPCTCALLSLAAAVLLSTREISRTRLLRDEV